MGDAGPYRVTNGYPSSLNEGALTSNENYSDINGDGVSWTLDSYSPFDLQCPPNLQQWNSLESQDAPWMLNTGCQSPEELDLSYNEPRSIGWGSPNIGRQNISLDLNEDASRFTGDGIEQPMFHSPGLGSSLGALVAEDARRFCGQCSLSFSTSQDLERHAISLKHLAYVCKTCGKGYSRRDTIVRHTKKHKGGWSYFCDICALNGTKKRFLRKDHLAQHVRKTHERRCHFDSARGGISCCAASYYYDHKRDALGDDLSISTEESLALPVVRQRRDSAIDLADDQLKGVGSALVNLLCRTDFNGQLHDDHKSIPYSVEKERLVRGLAPLALVAPNKLPTRTRERLCNLVQELESINLAA